ncbi:Alpha/beta hydrolase fold-1 [Microdochium trichocladiopsis]|uniref:Alpha/beta hydrolase fold-1 n=1 Tax=Microdochium trichocladiopsis TaxID=1682393 RepID=A0A9P8YGP2_9PEZI|nr:Alpha/beta hydrolase fold-1 [Microdochium trichocladiopsis]KAH7040191.1 Alpha/beta hydrolase fold-1 [Microdochium trichocladiopsis]
MKTVICLVHGAGHQPLHYKYLIDALRRHGLTVAAPPLPTSGYDDASATKTHLEDVARVREYLVPFLEQGYEAILVGHSYGGRIITQAAAGLTGEERAAAGQDGGVVALVYIAAFTEKEQPLTPEILGVPPEDVNPATKLLWPEAAIRAMYHDIEPGRANEAVALLQRQSPRDLDGAAVCKSSDVPVPKRYVACRQDRVISFGTQLQFAEAAVAKVVAELESGHSPWLRDDGIRAIVDCVLEFSRRRQDDV